MLCVSRLIGRPIRRHRRFAAARLTHWSALRTIHTAARRHGTRLRCGHTQAERKQQSDKDYGEKAHDRYLSPAIRNRQSLPILLWRRFAGAPS